MPIVVEYANPRAMVGAALGAGDRRNQLQDRAYGVDLQQLALRRRSLDQSADQFDRGLQFDRERFNAGRQDLRYTRDMEQRQRASMAAALFGDAAPILGGMMDASTPAREQQARDLSALDPRDQLSLRGRMDDRQQAEQLALHIDNAAAEGLVPKEILPMLKAAAMDPRTHGQILTTLQTVYQKRAAQQTARESSASALPHWTRMYGAENAAWGAARVAAGESVATVEDDLRQQMAQLKDPIDFEQQARDLRTVHPRATPEAAMAAVRLRAGGIPIGVGDANLSGRTRTNTVPALRTQVQALRERITNFDEIEGPAYGDKKRSAEVKRQLIGQYILANERLMEADPDGEAEAATPPTAANPADDAQLVQQFTQQNGRPPTEEEFARLVGGTP